MVMVMVCTWQKKELSCRGQAITEHSDQNIATIWFDSYRFSLKRPASIQRNNHRNISVYYSNRFWSFVRFSLYYRIICSQSPKIKYADHHQNDDTFVHLRRPNCLLINFYLSTEIVSHVSFVSAFRSFNSNGATMFCYRECRLERMNWYLSGGSKHIFGTQKH